MGPFELEHQMIPAMPAQVQPRKLESHMQLPRPLHAQLLRPLRVQLPRPVGKGATVAIRATTTSVVENAQLRWSETLWKT